MPGSREPSGLRGMPAAIGRALLMVLPCAGPLLVAGGVAVAVGASRRNPWLIAVGAVMVLAAVARTPRYRSRRGAGLRIAARPSPHHPTQPAKADRRSRTRHDRAERVSPAAMRVEEPRMAQAPVPQRKVDRDEVFVEFPKSICPLCKTPIDAQLNVRDNKASLRKRCHRPENSRSGLPPGR
jgi:hypothetical protein